MKFDRSLLLSGLLLTLILVAGVPASEAASNVVELSHSLQEKIENGVPSGKIQTIVTLKNIGDSVAPPFIYEAQVLGVASFSVIGSQNVCAGNHPENQYRSISQLQPGEQITFIIESPKLQRAIYNVYGVSFSNCCFAGTAPVACSPTQPYLPSGSKLLGQVQNTGGTNPTQAVCGDLVCQATESVTTCPFDCSGRCNDGVCHSSESTTSCPQDCGFPPGHCGNNLCEPQYAENTNSCSNDCKPPSTCGNNVCDSGETFASCAADCKNTTGGPGLNFGGYLVPAAVLIGGGLAIWFVSKKVKS